MAWDWLQRMVGLDPNKINPALPEVGKLATHIKALEPVLKKIEGIYFDELAPLLKLARPDLDAALRELDIIAPAVQDMLRLLGVNINLGKTQDESIARIRKSLALADPTWDMLKIQQALQILGYDLGEADGKLGPKTAAAITHFQVDHGLKADGWAGPNTISSLKAELQRRGA